jgi:nicotinamide-nucleotide amidase
MLDAEIICTGSELLTNPKVETNSLFLAAELENIGIETRFKTIVGDSREDLLDAIDHALKRTNIVIISGGLGPTVDDLTRDIIAEILNKKLEFHPEIWENISQRIQRFFPNKPFPEMVKVQAYVPEGVNYFLNQNGTAPGLAVNWEGKEVIALPGPPRELIPMWQNQASEWLVKEIKSNLALSSKVIRIYGIAESIVNEEIFDLFKNSINPKIGVCAHPAMVDIRMLAWDDETSSAREKIDVILSDFKNKFGDNIYGYDRDTLESVVVALLVEKKKTLSLAESCTGGMISSRITDIAGCSDVYMGGVVSYSNDLKMKYLGVPREILDQYGAVSPETAKAMAKGVKENTGSDISLAVTGIAGPGGGSPDKPVGLVYIALAGQDGYLDCQKFIFKGDRELVRVRTVNEALDMLRRYLLRNDKVK